MHTMKSKSRDTVRAVVELPRWEKAMSRQMTDTEIETLDRMMREGADHIREEYDRVIKSVAKLGKVLRTELTAMWATEHKTSITGIKTILEIMRQDVPHYK